METTLSLRANIKVHYDVQEHISQGHVSQRQFPQILFYAGTLGISHDFSRLWFLHFKKE